MVGRPFATIFWECASKNLTWSHLCECMVCTAPKHRKQSRGSAETARMQSAPIVLSLAASARARRCAQRTERNGRFGFQTKVKDHFLNQRRWTCWYSCRENMQVLSATASLVLLFFFVFVLKSLLSLPHVTLWRLSLFFLYYYYLIPQCLLNIL